MQQTLDVSEPFKRPGSSQEVNLNASFGKTFNYKTPMSKAIHPEIDHLLLANPGMSCLQAGTSNLGQATFKVMRNTNLMRF